MSKKSEAFKLLSDESKLNQIKSLLTSFTAKERNSIAKNLLNSDSSYSARSKALDLNKARDLENEESIIQIALHLRHVKPAARQNKARDLFRECDNKADAAITKAKNEYQTLLDEQKRREELAGKRMVDLINVFTAFPENERETKAILYRHRSANYEEAFYEAMLDNATLLNKRRAKEFLDPLPLPKPPRKEEFTGVVVPLEKISKAPVFKKAEQDNTLHTPSGFNMQAYQVALKTMSQAEAYKLAKDPEQSTSLLDPKTPLEAPERDSNTLVSLDSSEGRVKAPMGLPVDSMTINNVIAQGDVKEVATFTERTVLMRSNQAGFAERVSDNFKGCCAVTGGSQGVQACHIEPITLTGNNNTSNGVLLLSSLHYLMDHGLMAIHPETLCIHFSPACDWFAKAQFEGKQIAQHSTPLDRSALLILWEALK